MLCFIFTLPCFRLRHAFARFSHASLRVLLLRHHVHFTPSPPNMSTRLSPSHARFTPPPNEYTIARRCWRCFSAALRACDICAPWRAHARDVDRRCYDAAMRAYGAFAVFDERFAAVDDSAIFFRYAAADTKAPCSMPLALAALFTLMIAATIAAAAKMSRRRHVCRLFRCLMLTAYTRYDTPRPPYAAAAACLLYFFARRCRCRRHAAHVTPTLLLRWRATYAAAADDDAAMIRHCHAAIFAP